VQSLKIVLWDGAQGRLILREEAARLVYNVSRKRKTKAKALLRLGKPGYLYPHLMRTVSSHYHTYLSWAEHFWPVNRHLQVDFSLHS
jgi:hypothetical protein